MDQLVKSLLWKYEELNSDTQCPHKNPDTAVHNCNAKAGETDAGRPQGLAAQSSGIGVC